MATHGAFRTIFKSNPAGGFTAILGSIRASGSITLMWHTGEGVVPDSEKDGCKGATLTARFVVDGRLNIGTANAFVTGTRRKGGVAATTSDQARRARAGVTMM